MFDLAWSEIMLIGAVALVVIGPKELPGAIRTVSQFIRKARDMAWEFRGHVDEMVREANLDEVRNQINEIRNFDVKGEVQKAVDPDGSLRRTVTEAGQSIQDAARGLDEPAKATPAEPAAAPPADAEAPATEPPAPPALTAAPEAEAPPAFLPPEAAPAPAAPPPPLAGTAEPPSFVPPGTSRS